MEPVRPSSSSSPSPGSSTGASTSTSNSHDQLNQLLPLSQSQIVTRLNSHRPLLTPLSLNRIITLKKLPQAKSLGRKLVEPRACLVSRRAKQTSILQPSQERFFCHRRS
ncbi:hypothetical protein CF327_g5986 [Tilletia walkeri]|nr:hypothetical protein CF327_g5986 [Tilletia walkeri]